MIEKRRPPPTRKAPDFAARIAVITRQIQDLDAAVSSAEQALDEALLAGQDTRPCRGQLRQARASREQADRALQNVIADRQEADRQRQAAAARAIDAKAEQATAALLAQYDFALDLPG